MRKQVVFLACALFSVGAMAAPEQVKIKVSSEASETTITTLMGEPTAFQQRDVGKSATCSFKSEFGSTIELTINGSYPLGLSASVFPVESDVSGVKVFLDISKTSGTASTLAVITKDCQLPVGDSSTMRIGKLETYKWDEPTRLKFSDGSFVTVTVSKVVGDEAGSL